MLHNPNVYRKAQEEVDRVVGRDRLPELSDRGSLPYVEAIIMETYRCVISNIPPIILNLVIEISPRWHPPLPLGTFHCCTRLQYILILIFIGLPHVARKSDYYEGYYIPKGALVIGNVWYVYKVQ